jgi:transcriptional regulator with XRE-family HTH domain
MDADPSFGVMQSYLSAFERGEKEPGSAVLLAISQEFGKSVDWLLSGHIHAYFSIAPKLLK